MPESDVVELSSEEVEKKSKKKRSGNKKSKDSKKVEKTKSKRKSSAEKRKRSQGPGAQNRSDESVNMQEVVDNLRKQAVLAGRVFDMGIINFLGMDSLHDMVEINHGCFCSIGNLLFSMKKKCANSIITFNSKKKGVSSQG